MSTEYEANSGLGYRVIASDAIKDSEALEDGLHEYIFNECSQGFDFFQVGNASNGVTGVGLLGAAVLIAPYFLFIYL